MQLVNIDKYPLKQASKAGRFWHIATVIDADREFQAFYDTQDEVVDVQQVVATELRPVDDRDRAHLDILLMVHGVTAKPMELPW